MTLFSPLGGAARLLGVVLVSAALVAACGDGSSDSLTNGKTPTSPTSTGTGANATDGTDAATGTTSSPVATNSPAGKAFYIASVHPLLQTTCGTCHGAAGPGPAWFTPTDAEQSYAQLFQAGYVVQNSRITVKGAHDGSTTNVLSADQIATFNKWVSMELADGGKEAPPSILAKLGDCFDRTLFDAMKMGEWKPTPRGNGNNPGGTFTPTTWNENANNCTGCNSPCYTCHSADPATGYANAVGSALSVDTTFNNTKMTAPPYITKFFAVSPDGKAIASNGIQLKSDSTKKTGKGSHPWFELTAAQKTAVQAFTADTVSKYTAGTCGK